jgi:hypothetical protein
MIPAKGAFEKTFGRVNAAFGEVKRRRGRRAD